jgi:DNA repair protein RecO (recombination protein O)
MPPVSTPAIVLSAIRFSETSKIVRLATRDLGIQSAIAKGALRPKSSFGASLQALSEGQAQLYLKESRELQTLAAFDLTHLRVGLAGDLSRYAAASALAELALRVTPASAHPSSYDLLSGGLTLLETAPIEAVDVLGLRLLWRLISVLGFAPSLDHCVRDGTAISPEGPLAFSAGEGGALCTKCAIGHGATRLSPGDRADLVALVEPQGDLPTLDARHTAAHRRLLARFLRYHLGDGAALPALAFWEQRPWESA